MFDRLVDGASAALWDLDPAAAVALGKHEYDGHVAGLDAPAVDARVERLRLLRERLAVLDGLDDGQQFDRRVMVAAISRAVLDWSAGGPRRRDPWAGVAALGIRPYLARPYAPFGRRIEQAVAVLDHAPEVLSGLPAGTPAPVMRRAIRRSEAAAWWLEHAVAGRVAGAEDPAAAGSLVGAAAFAAGEIRSYAQRMEAALASAPEDAALGAAHLEAMLRDGEALGGGIEEAAGAAGKLPVAAAEDEPPGGGDSVMSGVWEGAAAVATIPDGAEVQVEPELLPDGVRLAVDLPGPYDDAAPAAHCGVPDGVLDGLRPVLARELLPGRYLQALHHSATPIEVRRRTASPAFVEGWAAYAAALAGPDPGRALDDARLLAVVEIHAERVPVREAARRLRERAGLDEAAATVEADECASDPWRWSAALGRHHIARRCGSGGPAAHDELLGRGAPPVGMLTEEVPR